MKLGGAALGLGSAALVGAALAWRLKPAPAVPAFRPTTLVVHDTTVLYRDKPSHPRGILDRVFTREKTPTQVVTTSTTPELPRVRDFCQPVAVPPAPVSGDTTNPAAVPAAAVLPPIEMRFDGARLRIWSALGDGRAFYQETRTRAPFSAFSRDSTMHVLGPRLSLHVGATIEASYLSTGGPLEVRAAGALGLGNISAQLGARTEIGDESRGALFAGLRATFGKP